LQNTNLYGANLWGVNLQDANLHGARFWGANLQDADLERAKLWAADLEKAKSFTEIQDIVDNRKGENNEK